MSYKGWIIAIYEKYNQRYNEKYKNINRKKKFKDLETKKKLILIVYSICVISGTILYGRGIVLNNLLEYIIGTLFMICSPIIIIYFDKFQIEVYKRHARVLREILEEENINKVSIIERLIGDTAGVLYKIKNGEINNYIKLASSLIGIFVAALGANLLDRLNGNAKKVAIIIIIIIIFGLAIYLISLQTPNTKRAKVKELHETLKILLIYEEGRK
ncbi:hypothetical protein [Clostridium botulinum]|uniref:hypothetical protein n=1 Tax=Clostridium botulinum TaxID=1491 RepID=UPI00077449D1|nr:hypothetical protein [Clostridium botulinum]MBY6931274.1 hypothetical protein [Clostridium botulinum]NFG19796.1 hypothetical protein [Clostridium botulinum]NFO79882.1 hypothetical protein [Clostridium botulinum]